MITKINEDSLSIVLTFCNAKSLCNLAQTCRKFYLATTDNSPSDKSIDSSRRKDSPTNVRYTPGYTECLIFEEVWKYLCIKRWRIDERICRRLGTTSMRNVYRMLSHRIFLPRGRYTEKHNYIFAKAKREGICGWSLVGHTANARLRSDPSHNFHVIDLRIGIQNAHHGLVAIDISPQGLLSTIVFNSLSCEEDFEHSFCYPVKANVVAFNGVPTDKTSSDVDKTDAVVYLGPLDFVLLSIEVMCPQWMVHETDFLSSMRSVDIKTRVVAPIFPFDRCLREITVSPAFLDEDKIWDYYEELPGGIVLLRGKPVNAW
jgi:hypothetical protein